MHPADIQAALIKAGSNQVRIAKTLGVSNNAVSIVIHGRMTSLRIARTIATVTGISINKLWPGCYIDRHPTAK